jgi:signal transduction histidine kinase
MTSEGWFAARPRAAVDDFFELCEVVLDGHDAASVQDLFRSARAGDWQPLEHRLGSSAASDACAGRSLAAWPDTAPRFRDALVACAVAAHGEAPARLGAVLLVIGDYFERSLAIQAGSYHAARDRFVRELEESGTFSIHILEQIQAAESASRLEIVATTGHEFATASGNIALLLELVACRLGEIIGDGCAVRLISDDGAWLEPSASFYHRDPERRELARRVLASERQRIGDGLAGTVAATGEPVLIPVVDAAQFAASSPAAFRTMLLQLGVTSALALPLRSRDRTIGAISLLRTRPGQPYTVDDQHLAQDLADRAGLAIDNAVLVATLEQRVAERTAALETSNRELEAFSYSVSHDLRTPLRAIDGFSRALVTEYEDRLGDEARHYLHRIRAGTQRMAALIDDLLDLARITREPLRRQPLDLSAIARDVVAELHRREPARAVAFHVAPDLSAHADARLLRIALENLLGNAWKFTARHDPAEIWFGREAAVFHVRDTGAGFDMAYAGKLFAPFQRLHTVKQYDGTGIGLATVHRIISHHGGRIWAEAEVDKGATFFFTLGDHR